MSLHILQDRYTQHSSDDKKLNDLLHYESYQIIEQHCYQALGDCLRPYKDLQRRHTNPEDSPEQQKREVAPYKFLPANPH